MMKRLINYLIYRQQSKALRARAKDIKQRCRSGWCSNCQFKDCEKLFSTAPGLISVERIMEVLSGKKKD